MTHLLNHFHGVEKICKNTETLLREKEQICFPQYSFLLQKVLTFHYTLGGGGVEILEMKKKIIK